METVVILAIAGCLFSGSVVYVVMDYYKHTERQTALENVLRVQAKTNAVKNTLLGYTKYADYLAGAKQATTEKMRSLSVRLDREHIHVEKIKTDELDPKAVTVVLMKYVAEYTLGFDLVPESFEIVATAHGIEVKVKRPKIVGEPVVKSSTHDIPGGQVLEMAEQTLRQIRGKLPVQAQQHGLVIAAEEAVRALCEKKLLAHVSSFLAAQEGVTQVPVITVTYS